MPKLKAFKRWLFNLKSMQPVKVVPSEQILLHSISTPAQASKTKTNISILYSYLISEVLNTIVRASNVNYYYHLLPLI